MAPIIDGGPDPEPPVASPDTEPDSPNTSPDPNATARRLDRWLSIGVGLTVVALVALSGWFAYNVWAQREASNAASPTYQVIQAMAKQVDAKPGDPTLHSRYAEALGAAGRLDEAKQQLALAIKLDPKYVGAYENLAIVEILQKDYRAAETHLNKVLDLTATGDYQNINERRELAYYHLGEIALTNRRFEDAVGYFKAALRIRKDASDTYVRLAQAYVGMGEKDQARTQLQVALKFDPRFAEAHYEMGKLYVAAGDKPNAAWEFRASLDAAPNAEPPQAALDTLGTYDEWFQRATAADKAGKSVDALAAVRVARAMQPGSFDAAMLNGRLLEASGDLEGAVEAYTTASKLRPDDSDAKAALGRATIARKKGAK